MTFEGEEDGVILIQWLNAAIGSNSYERVFRLIRNIQLADAAVDTAHRDNAYVHSVKPGGAFPPNKLRRQREVRRLLRPVEKALTAYVFHPRLSCVLFGRPRWWFDLAGDRVTGEFSIPLPYERRFYEADAVFAVLRVASSGFLTRVKQCLTCDNWLYAKPAHQKFCQKKCQLKHFSVSPHQKSKRATYMRQYRRQEKEREQRSLRTARKP